jgi:hypothetical protein
MSVKYLNLSLNLNVLILTTKNQIFILQKHLKKMAIRSILTLNVQNLKTGISMNSKKTMFLALAALCCFLAFYQEYIFSAEKGHEGGGGAKAPSRAESRAPIRQQLEQVKSSRVSTPVAKGVQENIKKTLPERFKNETMQASKVRENIQHTHPESSKWFNKEFFAGHNYTPEYERRGSNWSRHSRWGGVTGWLGWNSNAPLYYSDEGYPVEWAVDDQTPNDQDYVQQQVVQQQAVPQQVAQEESESSDWMPLGVFALGKTIPTASTSNLYVELAVSKQGDISGTYYDANADRTHAILGIIDKDTQIAAWKFSDVPNAPLMTTGVYNLTRDVVPIVLYSLDGTKKQEVLVNLNP